MGPLAQAVLDALPQTQCTRCGYADCRGYAEAIANGSAGDQPLPPGGPEGIERLARITGRPVAALDPAAARKGRARSRVIDEAACIGCALCLKACPVDAIVGAAKHMHTVIDALCTGCELACRPARSTASRSSTRAATAPAGRRGAPRPRRRHGRAMTRTGATAARAGGGAGSDDVPLRVGEERDRRRRDRSRSRFASRRLVAAERA